MFIPRIHITQLLVSHFPETVYHKGKHFSEGDVRAAGFWTVGEKRVVGSTIFSCVTRFRLQGKQEEQILGDLPEDRLCIDPFFHIYGPGCFWSLACHSKEDIGGQAEAKRLVLIFTCMSTHAIHIDMKSYFFAIRGASKLFRSGCRTNIVNACKEL